MYTYDVIREINSSDKAIKCVNLITEICLFPKLPLFLKKTQLAENIWVPC